MKFKFTSQTLGHFAIATIALTGIVFHLSTYHLFEFHRDELLYLSLGEHLDLGYHSVPPLIGFLAFISTKIFGYSLFAARFFPAIAGGILIVLSAQIVKELKGGIYAQILCSVSILVSILFVRTSGLFQPVVFDILFWTTIFYLIIRYFNTNQVKFLIYLGISVGIGFLNKYNIIFLVFAIFTIIPFTKYRKVFRSKFIYFAGLIALLIVSPNIWWQFKHHLPVITHFGELRNSQLVNMNASTFLTEQILMIMPASVIAFPGFIMLFFSKSLKEYRLLGFVCLSVLLIFLLMQGKSYYTAGIYPLLIAAGSVGIEKAFRKRLVIFIMLIFILLNGWIMLPMGKPIYEAQKLAAFFDKMKEITGNDAIRRFEDNQYQRLPQDYADMLGWEELTKITAQAVGKLDNKQKPIIYAENYGQAGAITIIGKKYGLPQAISFNDQFGYWIPQSFDKEITEFIYINDELGDDVKDLFADIDLVGKISNPLAREYGTAVYLCTKPNKSFNAFWAEIIKDR